MSYILDALRKSDQQRQRGVPPTLLAPQSMEPPRARRVSMPPALLVAALVGIGIVIGALRPWQAEQPAPATPVASNKPLEASAPATVVPKPPQTPRKPAPVAPAPKAAAVSAQASRPASEATGRKVSASTRPDADTKLPSASPEAVAAVRKDAAKPSSDQRDAVAAGESVAQQKTVPITDLPVSIRQELPKITITVHAFSPEPGKRLVGVNDRVLREGESVAPGLTLEQITPDGLILSYKGYRFQRGVR